MAETVILGSPPTVLVVDLLAPGSGLKLGLTADPAAKQVGFVLQTAKGDIPIDTAQANVILAMRSTYVKG